MKAVGVGRGKETWNLDLEGGSLKPRGVGKNKQKRKQNIPQLRLTVKVIRTLDRLTNPCSA
jgi:hypothetical protein